MNVEVSALGLVNVSLQCPPQSAATVDIFHSLPLSHSGWSTPTFFNWWTSSRPRRSTSSSWSCEFSRLMRVCRASCVSVACVYVLSFVPVGINLMHLNRMSQKRPILWSNVQILRNKWPTKKHHKHVGSAFAVLLAGRCLTGYWTKATIRSETPAMWSGRCWKLWPICTLCKLSTETSR